MARISKAEATLIERAGSDPLHGEEMRVRLTFTDEILATALTEISVETDNNSQRKGGDMNKHDIN